jgi:hypothetical protein
VDGQVVSGLAAGFELLPGCHVVETQRRLLFSSASWTRTEDVGSRAFVIHMKPGHHYMVVVDAGAAVVGYPRGAQPGIFGRLAIYAEERDPTGARTARLTSVEHSVASCAPVDPARFSGNATGASGGRVVGRFGRRLLGGADSLTRPSPLF